MAKKVSFEQSMARLEEIVRQMETGERSLDEAMHLFAEGAKLAAALHTQLEQAEQKVTQMTPAQDGTVQEQAWRETDEIDARLQAYIDRTEQALADYLTADGCQGQDAIVAAMRYSALAGGKRLRPVWTMEFCRASGGNPEDALPFACALEMIHTYSLIHDDLPCMDNDDLRRGMPTSHKKFGEGMAVLAGDALLTYAFETAAGAPRSARVGDAQVVRAIGVLAHEAGYHGMIGGQVLDLAAEHQTLTYDELVCLQDKKTGGLIRAAAQMGCILGGASAAQQQAARTYADRLGLAFQIEDDILDIEGEEAVFGKPIGSDAKSGKSTFPGLLGIAECKNLVQKLTDEAVKSLKVFPESDFLAELAQRLVGRSR